MLQCSRVVCLTGDALKDLLQVRLHTSRVPGLAENLQQLVRRQEVEPWEGKSLRFQVVSKAFLDLSTSQQQPGIKSSTKPNYSFGLPAHLEGIPGLGITIMTKHTQALPMTAELTHHSNAPSVHTSYLLKKAVGLCQVLQQLLICSDHQHLQQTSIARNVNPTAACVSQQQHIAMWYAAKLLMSQT